MNTESRIQTLQNLRDIWVHFIYEFIRNILFPMAAQKKVAITAFVLVFGYFLFQAIAAGYTYTATASLLLSPPAYQTQGPSSELMPIPLDMPSYARLLVDDEILRSVADAVLKANPEFAEQFNIKNDFNPPALRRMLRVDTEVVEKTPNEIRYSSVIRLTARAKSPELTKALLDEWVSICINKVRTFEQPGSALTVKFMDEEYFKAKNTLEKLEEALRKHQVEQNLSLWTASTKGYEEKHVAFSSELRQLDVDIAQVKSQLSEVQRNLATEEKKIVLKRSPSNDAFVIAEAGRQSNDKTKGYPVFADEVLNEVWVDLRNQETKLQSALSGYISRHDKMQSELALLEKDLTDLRAKLVTQTIKQDQLLRDVEIGKVYYSSVAKKREEAMALQSNVFQQEAGSIILANNAVLPTNPDSKMLRWSRIPAGFILAILVAVALSSVVYEYRRIRTNQLANIPDNKTAPDAD